MSNLTQMLKQAQGMQQKIEDMQAALAALEVTGEAGGGLVKVTLSGKSALKAIDIDPSLCVPEEREVLEDLIVAAHSEAKTKIEQIKKEEMADLTGGLALPPGMKLPF